MTFLLRAVDAISRAAAYLAAALVAYCAVGMVVDVSMRYVFNETVFWLQETITFAFGSAMFLGAPYTLQKSAHVRIDVLFSRLSPRRQALTDVCTFIFFFFFVGAIIWYGWDDALMSWDFNERTETVWGPVIWPYKFLLVASCILLFLQGCAQLVRNFDTVRGKDAR
ncbi:MAG: TRAP transporter small permease subunit [Synergistaceae bacterium]|jgi:TRAP-type mannitol/chloroaromatic compound transport system permease small subunit|nr:TRAP transporter small permease subunit [Synergistaceae bacterium]